MSDSPIKEFGRLFVKHVRDEAIRLCDQQVEESTNTPVAERWREDKGDPEPVVVDCVDLTLYAFLNAIDKGLIRLRYRTDDGETIDLNKDGAGELTRLLLARWRWRIDYSSERYSDDMLAEAEEDD